ncbi:MAG TPA: transposase [Bryobacteraceae bacterium]|nr:transposase [Bryobacteraceae bacterium]
MTVPAGYLLTFSTYGTRLHGDERFTVDRNCNRYGAPLIGICKTWQGFEERLLSDLPFIMDQAARKEVLSSVKTVAGHRNWRLWAAHVRTNHVHIVVQSNVSPERAIVDFKAYATRALRAKSIHRKHYWTRHGSTRYLWREKALNAAVDYVINGQGIPMAIFPETNREERHLAEVDGA